MKTTKIVARAAIVGCIVPLLVVLFRALDVISGPQFDMWTLIVWPTSFLLLGFAGPGTIVTLFVFIISVALNAGLFALIAAILCVASSKLFGLGKRTEIE